MGFQITQSTDHILSQFQANKAEKCHPLFPAGRMYGSIFRPQRQPVTANDTRRNHVSAAASGSSPAAGKEAENKKSSEPLQF